jgi:hypothetical protein
LAWAKHTAGGGMTLEQIKAELLDGRDLGKQGNRRPRSNTPSARQRRLYEASSENTTSPGAANQRNFDYRDELRSCLVLFSTSGLVASLFIADGIG